MSLSLLAGRTVAIYLILLLAEDSHDSRLFSLRKLRKVSQNFVFLTQSRLSFYGLGLILHFPL